MKRNLFLALASVLLLSCSEESTEIEPTLELSTYNVEVHAGNIAHLNTIGVEPSECSFRSGNSFFAYAAAENGKVSVIGKKVGETVIHVSYKTQSTSFNVVIKPNYNIIPDMYIRFGSSTEDVRKNAKGSLVNSGENTIRYSFGSDEVEYTFKDGNLVAILVYLNKEYNKVIEAIAERCTSYNYDGESTGIWLEVPNIYVVNVKNLTKQYPYVRLVYARRPSDIPSNIKL